MQKFSSYINGKLLSSLFISTTFCAHVMAMDVDQDTKGTLNHHGVAYQLNLKPSSQSSFLTQLQHHGTHNNVTKAVETFQLKRPNYEYAPIYDFSGTGVRNILDQGQLGSCAANATVEGIGIDMVNQKWTDQDYFTPSRLFQYYNTRLLMGPQYISQDSGSSIADAIMAAHTYGFVNETAYPYSDNSVTFTKTPPQAIYNLAKNYTITQSKVNLDIDHFKYVIKRNEGIVFGATLYSSFQNVSSDGVVPMPSADEDVIGGHALVVVGWNDEQSTFKVLNSWSKSWGDQGYCYIPYGYFFGDGETTDTGYVDEGWRINTISKKTQ